MTTVETMRSHSVAQMCDSAGHDPANQDPDSYDLDGYDLDSYDLDGYEIASFQVGVELEILAPRGSSRAELADRMAKAINGSVVSNWHFDTEPSAHPDMDVFHHLTPAFDVMDANGALFARLVSDVTIHADLNVKEPGLPGWHRVLSDDPRFLRMIGQFLPSMGATADDLEAVAHRFGLATEKRGDTIRLHDSSGASVVMFTTMPGEKHRVTECISAPLVGGYDHWLQTIAGAAIELGFTVPSEGATHLHYDAHLFRHPQVFRRLVYAFGPNVDVIRQAMNTNPRCRRIGALPQGLVDLVGSEQYRSMTWDEIAHEASQIDGVTKYGDVNVLHLLADKPKHDTVEFRMLPSSLELGELRRMRRDVDSLVRHLLEPDTEPAL